MRTQSSVSLAWHHSNLISTEAKCWGRVNHAAAGFSVRDRVGHSSRPEKYCDHTYYYDKKLAINLRMC